MSEQFAALGKRLKDTYRQTAGETGPSEDEVKAAFRTLGGAWDRLAETIGAAARDEQLRENVKQAATGFFEAMGAAFSELGAELRRTRRDTATDTGDVLAEPALPDTQAGNAKAAAGPTGQPPSA
jgi:hypothetical protein